MEENVKASGNLVYLLFDKSIKADHVTWNISHAISPDDDKLTSGVYEATINFFRIDPVQRLTRLQLSWKGSLEFSLNKSLTEPYMLGLLQSIANEIQEFSKRNHAQLGGEIVIDLKEKKDLYQEVYQVLQQGHKGFPPDEL